MDLQEAQALARSLMDEYGLQDVPFEWARSVRRFGACYVQYDGPKAWPVRITLSRPLTELNDRAEVENTIRHEIAHALTPTHRHGRAWKLKAIEVGARPERCYLASRVAKPPAPYVLACGDGCETPRYRRTHDTYRCRRHGQQMLLLRVEDLR